MKKVDISIQNLSKIEGHANLDVKVRDGEVKDVKFSCGDYKRFFTQAIRGQSVETLPASVSRICGTCSIAHEICCIDALEDALGIEVSEQTKVLKKLTMYGLYIRDHALHVYMFSLPDVYSKDSVLDFEGREMDLVKDAFAIKKVGSLVSNKVAGRAVHAPFPQVGGFVSIPSEEDRKEMIKELKAVRKRVFPVLEVYFKSEINYPRETNHVALAGKEFNFLDGPLKSTTGEVVEQKDYYEHLEKVVLPYSQALGYKYRGDTYMVGAISRLNLNKKALHKNTKKDCAKYLKLFPSKNTFHNNLAQAIEIVHAIDHSIELLSGIRFKDESPVQIPKKEGVGVAAIEAPRGVLYYKLHVNEDGTIKEGTIMTPTQQNQINIELDVKEVVKRMVKEGVDKEAIRYELEKVIRSYDPCISCATHFLKVNWI